MIYLELFLTFFLIGILTFGGGYAMIPMIQEQVIGKNWMNLTELTDFIAISEATPGPFAINIATFVGSRTGGILGSVCATLGVVLPSFIIISIVAIIMNKFLKNRFVQGALTGVRPIVLSLILSTAILFTVRALFFSGNAINYSDFSFDRSTLGILISIFLIMFIYKKENKKSLNTLLILLISAVFGLILYS